MRPTQEQCDRYRRETERALGDLIPACNAEITPEQAEQVIVIANILMRVDKRSLAGSLGAVFLTTYGKAAPVIARRLVEMYPEAVAEDEDDL